MCQGIVEKVKKNVYFVYEKNELWKICQRIIFVVKVKKDVFLLFFAFTIIEIRALNFDAPVQKRCFFLLKVCLKYLKNITKSHGKMFTYYFKVRIDEQQIRNKIILVNQTFFIKNKYGYFVAKKRKRNCTIIVFGRSFQNVKTGILFSNHSTFCTCCL